MQMLSEFEKFGDDRFGARPRDEAAGGTGAKPAGPELLGSAKAPVATTEGRGDRHTISLTTAYGEVVAEEDVADADYGAALRRIYDEAVPRANAIVVLDGVMHTRNSFLEFVREFNDWAARQRGTTAAA
ncbi:hypothetical protein [Ramlibacter alkalitolerans]|uniref:Uncharacterized protein n=1 Tax=Ramlibacter alkalitolerans TaxID=2039631 RepID=A0ABS1JSQ3_9BURK|nr:hypothetical protein [Ramlibacter alkalitolerans]MBL0427248.1 hypothetical protein [Ramlibacter alkalitolerans]